MNTFQANGHTELKKVLTQTFKAQTKTEKAKRAPLKSGCSS